MKSNLQNDVNQKYHVLYKRYELAPLKLFSNIVITSGPINLLLLQ